MSDPGPPEPIEASYDGKPLLLSRNRPRHGGSILMAAMVGIAEALGLDPEPTEIAQPADLGNGPELELGFGDLPPLN